jgi:RNA polymerase sigma-70 factor (ECF subfamily)
MQEQIQELEVIQQVLQGKKQAYAVLVERYQHYVFTLVMRYVQNREEAEEVAQDVFVKAYRYLADFRGQSKFSTWLYTIVNTTCISFLRRKKDMTVLAEQDKLSAIAERAGMNDKASDYSERKSEKKMMAEAIRELPETDAQIITLFYQHEQTLEEIGVVLGLTSNHVKVRLYRARLKLKEILKQNYTKEVSHL